MMAMLRICIASQLNPHPGGPSSAPGARHTLRALFSNLAARSPSRAGRPTARSVRHSPIPPRLPTEALMEQHEETNPTSYPLGRGYGHDYMRGGEVFGGYGYRDREEYARTRGGDVPDPGEPELAQELAAGPALGGVETAEGGPQGAD